MYDYLSQTPGTIRLSEHEPALPGTELVRDLEQYISWNRGKDKAPVDTYSAWQRGLTLSGWLFLWVVCIGYSYFVFSRYLDLLGLYFR